MAKLARVPPGRAGRMWLRSRLATAQRGREQLDRKLHILIPERDRRRLQAEQWQLDWVTACEAANTWVLRATMLGGQDVIRTAAPPELADVEVTWASIMGLDYPSDARIIKPPGPPVLVPGNAAVITAATAFQQALLAGIRTAAAEEAVRRVDAEIAVTRRRLRALDKRWLPWLQDALADLQLTLEQSEQDDGIRLRRAVAAQPDRRPAP